MKYLASLLALISLGALTSAAPAPAPNALPDGWEPISSAEVRRRMTEPRDSGLVKRTVGGIYLCTGENWTGTCGYKVQPVCHQGQCNTRSDVAAHCVTLTSPWLRNIGSFGPDPDQTVYIDNNGDCNEAVGSISYPGSGDFFNYAGEDGTGLGGQITNFLIFG